MSGGFHFDPQPNRPPWGIRPEPRKQIALTCPARPVEPPRVARILVDQTYRRVGALVVREGQRVLAGEPLTTVDTALGSRVHSPVSGTVTEIARHPMPVAGVHEGLVVVIESDGADERHPDWVTPPSADSLSPPEIARRIAEAGIVGLGGALFPAAEKLGAGKDIEALILNGAECEPYIACDEGMMAAEADEVVAGAQIMMRALGTERCIIAVENDMPAASSAVARAIENAGDGRIALSVVTAKYPAGGERQLIQLITGTVVPPNRFPPEYGLVCQNVGTARAVHRLFTRGEPLISRYVTVTGSGIKEPCNVIARIGTPMKDLIAAAGGYVSDDVRLIMGGPMMGFTLPDDSLPVTKATNCLVVATADELPNEGPLMPCIRCGNCSEACPAGLMPQDLLVLARRDDPQALIEAGVEACIECGCCDHVCPSFIPLTQTFIQGKTSARLHHYEQQRAKHAEMRSEARSRRLEQAEQETADAMARADAAVVSPDAIAAIMQRVDDEQENDK